MVFKSPKPISLSSGFTLIEIIIGIVVLSISLSIVIQLIAPTEQQSADQIHQIKAAELGQSMLDEILAKAFDEKSDKAGGRNRCDEDQDGSGTLESDELCTTILAREEANDRNLFDDVDDYNGYSGKASSINEALDGGYDSFKVAVRVEYDISDPSDVQGLRLGLSSVGTPLAKFVTVTITTPLGTEIEFSGYKANF